METTKNLLKRERPLLALSAEELITMFFHAEAMADSVKESGPEIVLITAIQIMQDVEREVSSRN